jgi:formate hydrogenlyase subunit 3/multisubunit Na+/H+ antiporter MnhD subunit
MWFFYPLLIASMLLVVIAKNGFLFLFAWELMSLSSYFLVTLDDEETSLKAGYIYLIATNIGSLFLLPFFLMLSGNNLDINSTTSSTSLLFFLGLIGFGTKAGIFPFHGWLAKAHPASPSHISALMSGIMIKMGIYGILRMVLLLNSPISWGWILISLGLISAIIGISSAFSQKELKTILAYSSIENIGIIFMGIGLSIIGIAKNLPLVTILALTATLFHIINHALFKGLLFLGAGTIIHTTQIKNINLLGGLYKKMPLLSQLFLIGILSISAMPLLNGFISEFLFTLASLNAILDKSFSIIIMLLGLSIIVGLSFIIFSALYGLIFLGEERSHFKITSPPANMIRIMIIFASLCIIIGIAPFLILPIIKKLLILFYPTMDINLFRHMRMILYKLSLCFAIFFFILSILLFIRYRLLKKRPIVQTTTWGCGYDKPSSKMQYSFSSVVNPITFFFKKLFFKINPPIIKNNFPTEAQINIIPFDFVAKYFYSPLMDKIIFIAEKTRKLQHGRTQFYILYIFLTLIFLLLWKGG